MSTSSSSLHFTDSLFESMDEGHISGVAYLDLKKAFDTVDHSLLVLKLTEYGVSTASLKWFRSYLSQRSQQMSVGGTLSSKRNLTIGVPQGFSFFTCIHRGLAVDTKVTIMHSL